MILAIQKNYLFSPTFKLFYSLILFHLHLNTFALEHYCSGLPNFSISFFN